LAGIGILKSERRGVGLHADPMDEVGGTLHGIFIAGHARDVEDKMAVASVLMVLPTLF